MKILVLKVFFPQKLCDLAFDCDHLYLYGNFIVNKPRENISLIIVHSNRKITKKLSPIIKLVGKITEHKYDDNTVMKEFEQKKLDYIHFARNEDDKLTIKEIKLDNGITDNGFKLKIQIILYDLDAFKYLSFRSDKLQRLNTKECSTVDLVESDPVLNLLYLIRCHEQYSAKTRNSSIQKLLDGIYTLFLWMLGISLGFVMRIAGKVNKLKENAFLQHFLIWSSYVREYSFKRWV